MLDQVAPWYKDEPVVTVHEAWFVRVFWHLDTCRTVSVMTKPPHYGPIPWDAIDRYGERNRLSFEAMDVFVLVIRALDNFYIPWKSEQLRRLG